MTDVSQIDIPQIDHEEIEDRRNHDNPGAKDVITYRNYLAGRQEDTLTLQQSALLGRRATHTMVDNLLRVVVQSAASRLKLVEWQVLDSAVRDIQDGSRIDDSKASELKDFLDSTWLLNQMDRLQYRTAVSFLRDGNTAIMFQWIEDRVKFWLEPWWDGETGIFVFYDSSEEYDYVVKDFKLRVDYKTTLLRRNVYTKGLISRFVKHKDGWKEFGDTPYEPLVRPDGSPLSLPVVHFPNDTEEVNALYGTSEIAQLLSLQDDLNAVQNDISAVALLTAFQRIFVSGASIPASEIKLNPGGIFGVPGDARAQVVEPGDPSGLISIHGNKKESLSSSSRTPMHNITGQWPSGAAILQADMPLVDKTEMLGNIVGPRYTLLAHRATEYANAYGDDFELDEDIPITSVFAPSQRIDEITELDIQRRRADNWKILSSLPLEAMVAAGVDRETAQKIKDEMASDVVMDVGF